MITDIKEIENSALNLDQKNKARLVEKLLQSLRGKIDQEVEDAWIEEVRNRKESLKKGEASLHSSVDVLKEARKQIHK